MTARWSGEWARPRAPSPPEVEVLIPAFERTAELAVTLAGLAAQHEPDFAVILSDQSEGGAVWSAPSVSAIIRVLCAQGRRVRLERHLPRRGMAEHRQFLLEQSSAPYVLFLDSDVWMEPDLLRRMHAAIAEAGCGFVGSAVQGLSYLDDDRPAERSVFQPWRGPVSAERMGRDEPGFERWTLHNAANLAHVAAEWNVPEGHWLLYKVAWVGACTLFDRRALIECGGFEFWGDLPHDHAGEDVLAQWRVMERWGGAGILPSGAVHLEAGTTLPERSVDAFDILGAPTD